jgi:hypothetical protein
MKTFVVDALKGIRGGVQFGMSREEARVALAPEEAAPFSRGATSFDGFYGSTLQLSYDSEGRVEFIEFARGSRVLLDDYDLFGSEAEDVIEHLKKKHEWMRMIRSPIIHSVFRASSFAFGDRFCRKRVPKKDDILGAQGSVVLVTTAKKRLTRRQSQRPRAAVAHLER